jgi:hypothetical protein
MAIIAAKRIMESPLLVPDTPAGIGTLTVANVFRRKGTLCPLFNPSRNP